MRHTLAFLLAASISVSGCGGDGSTPPPQVAQAVAVLPAPSPAPAPAPAPTPTPTASPASRPNSAAATDAQQELPPLDLSDMRLWNYGAKWHASQWNNDFGAHPWRFDRVRQRSNGDTDFVLDSIAAPELIGQVANGYYDSGLWEADVTIPELREGMVVAPLWLYNHNTHEEFDFEFAGTRGLDVTIHAYPNGKHKQVTHRISTGEGWSGRRARFGIRVDVPGGWAEMLIDGKVVHRYTREDLGFFATKKFKPVFSVWATRPGHASLESWTGRWQGLAPGEEVTMTVHGYRYTPLER